MNYRAAYDTIMNLQAELTPAEGYREIKALAACYELQEYLANRIAATDTSEELDVDGFTEDIFPNGRE